uniref:(California timema) hypothetical protein n=1 Tax=Timema californicum TaxID=61474 RepID=A0A7R9P689_TIMCA|nr:unnamed protein product [Timema californicum]
MRRPWLDPRCSKLTLSHPRDFRGCQMAVKRGQEESDLERIQDLFPNDCLRLYDRDAHTMKMKGLIRKRSTTAARLQRALSAKTLRPETGPGDREQQVLPRGGQDKRQFLMEAPVQFTTGVQSQERHLFLFNDLLLVAKARSGGNFKLKDKVRVSELWLSRCVMDDVIEVNKSSETSFVMGWPTTNVVATFRRIIFKLVLFRKYALSLEIVETMTVLRHDDEIDSDDGNVVGCWALRRASRGRKGRRSLSLRTLDIGQAAGRWNQLGFDAGPATPVKDRKKGPQVDIKYATTGGRGHRNTQAARDLWWSKLSEVVATERDKEPRSTNIQVVYYDIATSIEYVSTTALWEKLCKTFSVGPDETARSCIRLALEHLEMRGLEVEDFQLWAKTTREEAPYPLIGHERPFAIKLSCLREGLSTEEGFDLDHCNNVHGPDPLAKCQFILRSKRKTSDCSVTAEAKKGSKKSRKSPMRIRQVFRRSVSKGEDCTDCPLGSLFGIPLTRLCDGDSLPKPVMAMLQQVFSKGPFTQGIFRKSANARLVRELRDKLDAGEDLPLDHVPVLVTAALLKEFLRSLPDPLLGGALYPLWMEAIECPDEQEKLLRIKRPREDCIGLVSDYSDRSTLGHVIANADINTTSQRDAT